jgi:hypothetical protein
VLRGDERLLVSRIAAQEQEDGRYPVIVFSGSTKWEQLHHLAVAEVLSRPSPLMTCLKPSAPLPVPENGRRRLRIRIIAFTPVRCDPLVTDAQPGRRVIPMSPQNPPQDDASHKDDSR